jgi:CO dehydrogenase maturation factor
MSYTIAVAGKGGVGKTTLCGLIADRLIKLKKTPLLVVDADANSNLNEVLGVKADVTLGTIREELAHSELMDPSPIPPNMTKPQYAEFKFNSALIEEDDYDMIVMGRTQGEGCYCFVNGVLKTQISKHASNYKYVLVDNEAGMEHISRGVLPHVDVLLLVSDCSRRGIQAAARIAELSKELKLNPKMMGLVVNRAPDGVLDEGTKEAVNDSGLTLLGVIPQDTAVYKADCEGKPIVDIDDSSPIKTAVKELIGRLGI